MVSTVSSMCNYNWMRARKERKLVPGVYSPQLSITTALQQWHQTTHGGGAPRTEGGDGQGASVCPDASPVLHLVAPRARLLLR